MDAEQFAEHLRFGRGTSVLSVDEDFEGFVELHVRLLELIFRALERVVLLGQGGNLHGKVFGPLVSSMAKCPLRRSVECFALLLPHFDPWSAPLRCDNAGSHSRARSKMARPLLHIECSYLGGAGRCDGKLCIGRAVTARITVLGMRWRTWVAGPSRLGTSW